MKEVENIIKDRIALLWKIRSMCNTPLLGLIKFHRGHNDREHNASTDHLYVKMRHYEKIADNYRQLRFIRTELLFLIELLRVLRGK